MVHGCNPFCLLHHLPIYSNPNPGCTGLSGSSFCACLKVTAAGGRIPIVLRSTRGVRDVGQWLCQVPWDRWNELGGWVTMLYPTAAVCARTERIWAQVPFADVVALLEPVVLDGAQ